MTLMTTYYSLYALDHELGGIHHGLAHTACALVAGNRHDGYLSESRGGNAINAGMDDVLHAGDYYFHVPRRGILHHCLAITFLLRISS